MRNFIKSHTSLAVIIVAAILVELTSAVMYYSAQDIIHMTVEKMMENPDLVTLLRPLMAYDMGAGHKTRWIEADNEYTTQVLYRLGFQWPTTAADYVHRFVDTIIGFGFFSV